MALRKYVVAVTFPHKGSKYPITHHYRGESIGPQTAAAKAILDAREKYGRRFRVSKGTQIHLTVTALDAVSEYTPGPDREEEVPHE